MLIDRSTRRYKLRNMEHVGAFRISDDLIIFLGERHIFFIFPKAVLGPLSSTVEDSQASLQPISASIQVTCCMIPQNTPLRSQYLIIMYKQPIYSSARWHPLSIADSGETDLRSSSSPQGQERHPIPLPVLWGRLLRAPRPSLVELSSRMGQSCCVVRLQRW